MKSLYSTLLILLIFSITTPSIKGKPLETVSEDSTPCPEELTVLNQEAASNEIKPEKTWSELEEVLLDEPATTTICPEEAEKLRLQSQSDELIKEQLPLDSWTVLQQDEITTLCPEQLNDPNSQLPEKEKGHTFSEQLTETSKANGISVKTLLEVQKDSSLLKLVEQKAAVEDAFVSARRKRQAASSYYPQDLTNYQQQSSETYQSLPNSYNTRTSINQPIREQSGNKNVQTYQQLQRQYQSYQPKNYNAKQPVKGYQNPSMYMRFPNNGNFKVNNYYKIKRRGGGSNRRQYPSGRPNSTTAKSTRATLKKKFRPSPVFV